MTKVSVIIPVYNREVMIKKAINSVLDQTFNDFEVIVVDDGSVDRTKEAVADIKDARVKYFHKENGGVSSARNLGIKEAKGEYICFLDSDDYYDPKKIEKQVEVLNKNADVDACYHLPCVVDESGNQLRPKSKERYIIKDGYIIESLLKRDIFLFIWTLMVKRDVARKLMFNEEMRTAEDIDFIYRLAYNHKMIGLREQLCFYVQHSGERLAHRDIVTYENRRRQLVESFINKSGCKDKKIIRLLKARFYYDLGEINLLWCSNLLKFYSYMIISLFFYPANKKTYSFLFNPLRVLKKVGRQKNRKKRQEQLQQPV